MMNELQKKIIELHMRKIKSDTKKMHRNLVRGIKLRRTLSEALARATTGPTTLYNSPLKTDTTNDSAEMTQIMADRLHQLGGDTSSNPSDELLDEFLAHSPRNSELRSLQVPHPQRDDFANKLRNYKPFKAGGRDKSNLYSISLARHNIQELIFHPCDYFLFDPIPDTWTQAEIFLLFKKGDVKDPTNNRPISLLNAIYKIISSHINSFLSKTLIKHQLINHTQIGGLANRRTSDHIYRVTQHMFKFRGVITCTLTSTKLSTVFPGKLCGKSCLTWVSPLNA